MPEMQEVFRMATQKVRQDPGALDRQVEKQRKAARNRRVGDFAVVLALVAAVGAAYAITRGDTPEVPANPDTISVGPDAGPLTMIDLATGDVTPIPNEIAGVGVYFAVSPDGTRVAYSSCCGPPAPLFVANLDGTNVHEITGPGADAYGAQWSPDGSRIVFQERDMATLHLGDLVVVDADGGNRTQLTNLDQTLKFGWWFLFSELRAGWRVDPLPHAEGRPRRRIRAGTSGRCRSPAGSRRSFDATPVGATTRRTGRCSRTSHTSASDFTGDHALDRERRRGNTDRGGQGQIGWPRWSPDGTQISFTDAESIFVLNVASGSTTRIADGMNAEWVDDHTLIIGTGGGS